MNWLKKLLSSKSTLSTPPFAKPECRSPKGPTSHERHLHYLAKEEVSFAAACDTIFQNVLSSPTSKAIEHGANFHIIDGSQNLMMSALTKGSDVLTLLPYFDNQTRWPVKVAAILPWTNGYEGMLRVVVNGQAAFGLYDHFFFANSSQYRMDEVCQFTVSGLIYTMDRIELEAKYSPDFCAYLPISEQDGGAEDELRFITRIQEIAAFDFYGIPFLSFKVNLAKVEDFDMTTTLFIPKGSALEGLSVGDHISGMAWMFGFLIK